MSITLTQANRQWSTRPADERFASLDDLLQKARAMKHAAREARDVPFSSLDIAHDGNEMILINKKKTVGERGAIISNLAFGQLCARVRAPADYLREMAMERAVLNLREDFAQRAEEAGRIQMLLHQNGGYTVRAVTGNTYARIWNADVIERLLSLPGKGWTVPPARGDQPSGLYLGDRDMFAFMVNENNRIRIPGSERGLARGFFLSNSETATGAFSLWTFLYDFVCGNHFVWVAQDVHRLWVRHVGHSANARAFDGFHAELVKYANASAKDDELKIERATRFILGKTEDEVIDRIFGNRSLGIGRADAREAYALAGQHQDEHGDPRSAWGFASGLTRLSQARPYASERVELDRAAGRVLSLVS